MVSLLCGLLSIAPPFAPDGTALHVPPSSGIDYRHVAAEITVEPALGTIAGRARYVFRSLGTPRHVATLHADRALEIVAVTDGKTALRWQRAKETITIALPSAAPVDRDSSVVVEWRGRPTDGMHFVTAEVGAPHPEVWTQGETTFARGWIPVWDYPNDRFTSALSVRVPKPFEAIANGRLLGTDDDGDYRVFRWTMEQDHVAYLLSVNVGRFVTIEDTAPGIGPGGADVPLQYV